MSKNKEEGLEQLEEVRQGELQLADRSKLLAVDGEAKSEKERRRGRKQRNGGDRLSPGPSRLPRRSRGDRAAVPHKRKDRPPPRRSPSALQTESRRQNEIRGSFRARKRPFRRLVGGNSDISRCSYRSGTGATTSRVVRPRRARRHDPPLPLLSFTPLLPLAAFSFSLHRQHRRPPSGCFY